MGHYLVPFYLCSPLAPPPTRSGDGLNFKPCGLGGGRGRPRVQASPGREPWGELPLLAPPGTARSRGATTAHHREPGSGSRRKVPLPAGVTASSPRGLWPPLRPSRPASSGSSHLPNHNLPSLLSPEKEASPLKLEGVLEFGSWARDTGQPQSHFSLKHLHRGFYLEHGLGFLGFSLELIN